ncbi:MAG: hypothetical protein CR994_01830 [Maribacter sp.]|nr:MAG: hypothetical protein CR994_01830 [Maribacter sp.]
MELKKIEELLEKYLDANTSIAEEKELRSYFSQENAPAHLKQYAPMFQYLSTAKEERYTKELSFRNKGSNYKWLSIAAMVVLFLGIYFGNEYQEKKEAEYAFNETMKALTLLADNFNKGTEKIAYLKEFENTTQKIYNKNQ